MKSNLILGEHVPRGQEILPNSSIFQLNHFGDCLFTEVWVWQFNHLKTLTTKHKIQNCYKGKSTAQYAGI